MINLSLAQALSLWSDLIDAEYGRASHGHDAEIYAYRLMSRDPMAEVGEGGGASRLSEDAVYEQRRQAAWSLVRIVEHFVDHRDARVAIDGHDPREWLAVVGGGFGHRVKVRVEGGGR